MMRTPYESAAAPTSHGAADPAEFNVVCRSKSNLPNRTDLGPVQTSNFSCTEPNVAIKYMKSSTYESIRIGRFVFGSTVPFYPTGLVG